MLILVNRSKDLVAQFYHATSYDQIDGLSSQFVWDINQDDNGRMWFLTQSGLDVFNGFQWQTITQTDEGVLLPSKRMSRIIKTLDGSFWLIGIDYQDNFTILKHDKSTQKWQNHSNQLISTSQKAYFTALSEIDGKTKILIGAGEKVYLGNNVNQEWISIQIDEKMGLLLNVDFIEGSPHIFMQNGIYKIIDDRLIKQTYEFEQLENYSKLGAIVAIKKELSGELALIGQKGIAKTLGKKLDIILSVSEKDLFTYSQRNAQFEIHPVFDAMSLFNSRLYGRFYNQMYKPIYSESTGTLTWANRFFIDRQNVLWIASNRGVKKFNNFSFESFDRQSGQNAFEITSIKALSTDLLFLGSNTGWQFITNDVSASLVKSDNIKQKLDHRIQGSVSFRNKIYAAASKSGLIEIDNKRRSSRVVSTKSIQSVTVFNNEIHFIDVNKVIYKLDQNFNEILVNDLTENFTKYFRKLYVSDDNRLFAFGEEGVIDVATNKLIFGKQEFENEQAFNTYDFIDYDENYFLIGTLNGVHLLNKNNYELNKYWYDIKHPVYALLKSKDKKNTYLGTDRGLYLISDDGKKILYTEKDGLVGNEVNRDALFESENGKIWIGTNKGLSILSREMLITNVEPPIIDVYSIYNLTEDQELINESTTNVKQDNSLAIRFNISGFYDEENLEIRYKLNENDQWIYEKGDLNGEKFFYSLSNGTYRFQIQAKEVKSDWSEIAFSPRFKIRAPFYQQFWFFALISALLAALVFITLRFMYYKNQEARLNQELEIRTKKLRDQHLRLAQQNKELIESNKSLDQFTSAVSHDLKSPLNSSIGLLDLLDSSYSHEELLHFTGMVSNNLKKMKSFILELIELSRNANQGVKFEALDLKKMVVDVYELFDQTTVQKSVDKRLLINGKAPFLGDKSRLSVVFSNLISNAINYHNPSVVNPFCDIRIDVLKDEVFITVRDNGKGIPKQHQEKIFDMFFRAETSVSGTGLGLFLVKEVIDKMGGSIKVNSEEGMGTTFYIILPNGSPLSKRAKKASSNLKSKSDKPISVDFNDEKFTSKT